MKHFNFTKKRLAVYISSILTTGFVNSSYAAEEVEASLQETEQEIEVIEVSGIRGSLIRSMDLKRGSSGVVDVISAEDMGKFPDTNLAESLQRITGVSVSRSNGEGSEITVRGFGPEFNLITLNGRQMPGTGNTRSYALENLSSDGISLLEVHKSAKAKNPSGGLGATVNIITTKPLNNPGLKYVVSAKAIHDSSNEQGDDLTPEFSALYSNTFDDDTFGFALSLNYHRRDFQKQSANVQGWQANVDLPADADWVIDGRPLDDEGNPTGDYFFPRDMNYKIENIERERINGHATFQYSPVDNLVMTLDYTATHATTGNNANGWGMWNEYGGNINAYELDENGTAIYTDISGSDGSFSATRETIGVDEKSLGFNIEWHFNDDWHFELDYHDSESKIDNGEDDALGSKASLVLGSDQLESKVYDYRSGEVPQGYINWSNGTTMLEAGEIDSHFSQFVHSPGKSEIEQIQFHGTWDNSFDIPLVNVKFGYARTEQTMSGSEAWSGLVGGFGFSPSWTEIFPDGMFNLHDTSDFLDSFDGGGNDLTTNYYYTFDFDEVVSRSKAFLTNEVLGGSDYFDTTAYRESVGDNAAMGTYSEASVTEDTDSIYVESLWEFDVGNFPVEINLGFRYEETKVESSVFQDVPTDVWWKGGSEWHTQYLDGENNFFSDTGEHDVFLPMIDVKVDLTDNLVARASWGKTISRAPLGDLAGGRTLSGSPKVNSRTGTEGNPNLQPFESTNFDLSVEYYYAEGSYAAIGYFKKEVENFIGKKSFSTTIEGFNDIYEGPRWNQAEADILERGEQATHDAIFLQMQANGAVLNSQGYLVPLDEDPEMIWDITQPYNSPDDKQVDGFEIAIQHLFGDSGFGLGVNATFLDGDVEYDVEDLSGEQTPLVGLSDSANFQAFYEKHDLSVKVTYAWRDEYLIGVGQDQGSIDNPPQYAKEFGQWDMSVNYNVSDNVTVFFEGINLNNETEEGYGRYEEQFLFAREYGPRYTVGARYSFK